MNAWIIAIVALALLPVVGLAVHWYDKQAMHGARIIADMAETERDETQRRADLWQDLAATRQVRIDELLRAEEHLAEAGAQLQTLVGELHVMTMNRDNEERENRALKMQLAEFAKNSTPPAGASVPKPQEAVNPRIAPKRPVSRKPPALHMSGQAGAGAGSDGEKS